MSHHYGEAQAHLDSAEVQIENPEERVQIAIAHALLDIAYEFAKATEALDNMAIALRNLDDSVRNK